MASSDADATSRAKSVSGLRLDEVDVRWLVDSVFLGEKPSDGKGGRERVENGERAEGRKIEIIRGGGGGVEGEWEGEKEGNREGGRESVCA